MTSPDLWPHQQRVFDLLMEGKNVVLQAPTGSGKTRAALYPFLYTLDDVGPYFGKFPSKCIYSVPMRILAKQFVSEYQQVVHKYNLRFGLNISTAIQTGEQPNDRTFSSNLIFATIDQTISSFLVAPYSLPKRRANINAGAVLASYLVFDEFHLFDPISTLPTTLQMLRMLKGVTPFVLMTATFSKDMLRELASLLDAEIVPSTPEEESALQKLPSQDKERYYHTAYTPMTADAILDNPRRRTLVICNTVDRARRLYDELRKHAPQDTTIRLLHSQFLPEDRNRIEDDIREKFGKGNQDDQPFIVISTQAIEVGIDMTCDILHTELAPANAIIQRAGRCARYEGNTGDVIIYGQAIEEGEIVDLWEHPAPYMSQAEEFRLTWEQFAARSGEKLEFTHEQDILSAVHGKRDRELLQQLHSTSFDHRRDMFSVMRGDPNYDPRHLIRDIAKQAITIHGDPDELLERPFDIPSFGLHPGTLQGYIKRWLAQANTLNLDWGVQYLVEQEDPDQAGRSLYHWERLRNEGDEKAAWGSRLIVINPALATYDEHQGFLPFRGNMPECPMQPLPENPKSAEGPTIRYRLETYEEHIHLVYEEFNRLWGEMQWAARQLERRFKWQEGSVRLAAELAVLLHDVGKLSRGWQNWVKDYQAAIGALTAKGQAYAHTDWDPRNPVHQEAARRAGKRPTHAVEGAIAVIHILQNQLGEDHPLVEAAFSAVCRHHTSHSSENQPFRLVNGAAQHVAAAMGSTDNLRLEGIDETIEGNAGADEFVAKPEDLEAYLPYWLIVRLLRLADQEGTARNTKG
ncbi:MAG: CRISPR-associated helicase Cas3' [Chloroflexi bacterium]|nr:CRISPR-associated helicase Cas3' [Chloroflexota bacterium]